MATKFYKELVTKPGKFEGEARYVPYYWLEAIADYEQRKYGFWVGCYKVSPEDKKLFPELKRRKVVKLFENNDGFIMEIV